MGISGAGGAGSMQYSASEFARRQAAETGGTVSLAMMLATVLWGRAESGAAAVTLAHSELDAASRAGDREAAAAYRGALTYMLARGWDSD